MGKPLVSVCFVCYNQENYVLDALKSILGQSYSNIQYIISDDYSTDRTFEIIQCYITSLGENAPKNLILNRNTKNLGVVSHLNKLVYEYCLGQYLVFQSGDDLATPDRVEKVVKLLEETGSSAVAVNPVMIDAEGREMGRRLHDSFPEGVLGFEDYFVKRAPFFGGGGYHIDVYKKFGPLNDAARNEDVVLPLRASLLGGVAYLHDPVFLYREHGENMSFRIKMNWDKKNRKIYEIKSTTNYLSNLNNFLREVDIFYRGNDLNSVKSAVIARIRHVQRHLDFLSASLLKRIRIAIEEARLKSSLAAKFKVLLRWIAPSLYSSVGNTFRRIMGKV